MAKGKGQKKGGNNEREKAKQISRWWTEGERDDVFWRDNSGARATSRAKTGKSTAASYGDIVLQDPCGEALLRICTIELKRGYNSLNTLDLLDCKSLKSNIFLSFWKQVLRDSVLAEKNGWGKCPLLITQRDRKNAVITMDNELFNKIIEYCGPLEKTNIIRTILKKEEIDVYSIILEDFFNWCNPRIFDRMFATNFKKKRRNLL